MKACFQIAECCLSYANIAFLSEKNISFKYYYKKIRGFYYVFLQKVRGFLCAFCKKVRGFDKNIDKIERYLGKEAVIVFVGQRRVGFRLTNIYA